VIALSVLAMSVGLIRRTITAATAAALGLLGMAGVVIAGIAWTHRGLTATADGMPPGDLLILLIGPPLAAAIGGWLSAGREPPAVARQPLE
jgi:putative ABC transport system permease protein